VINQDIDEEAGRRLFDQVLQIWIHPELKRRLESGSIPNDYQVDRAQVFFDPNKSKPEVRLNKEIKAFLIGKLKSGIKKEFEQDVYEDEIEEIREVRLTDQDDPDAGHLTLFQFKGNWVIHFDFRMNKKKAKDRYEAAKQFFDSAKYCYEKKFWRPFVDNLFSCVELLATAQLFVQSEQEYIQKQSHAKTRTKYNSINYANPESKEYQNAFNKLYGLTDGA
jgi:hypothetical protein